MKYPRVMKRMSKSMSLTKRNIDKIPHNAHGVYVMLDKNGKALYVGMR